MKIGDFDTEKKVFIIAEIGNNHEGDIEVARKLIESASKAGVDAVKFQTIIPERLVASSESKRIEQLRKYQFTIEQFSSLAEFAKELGVYFLSTPFALESVSGLANLVPAFKIASSDNTFYPLLKEVAQTGKPIIMSTGLLDKEGIKSSVEYINQCWRENNLSSEVAVLHCVSQYPTEPVDAHLSAVSLLKNNLECTVGYSDHTLGNQACLIAVSLGARIIEKHFTLDHNYSEFRDHKLSTDFKEMKELVQLIRLTEQYLGDYGVLHSSKELLNSGALRRSVASKRNLDQGHVITEEDIIWVRPGIGIAPGDECKILGKKIQKSIQQGELFTEEHVL